jgi:hypothetical protein
MEMEGDLVAALNRNNELLQKRNEIMLSWRLPLRNGILAGVGSALGASLIVTILVWTLKPFESIEPLKPTLERISESLGRGKK